MVEAQWIIEPRGVDAESIPIGEGLWGVAGVLGIRCHPRAPIKRDFFLAGWLRGGYPTPTDERMAVTCPISGLGSKKIKIEKVIRSRGTEGVTLKISLRPTEHSLNLANLKSNGISG